MHIGVLEIEELDMISTLNFMEGSNVKQGGSGELLGTLLVISCLVLCCGVQ